MINQDLSETRATRMIVDLTLIRNLLNKWHY